MRKDWAEVELGDVSEINPKPKNKLKSDFLVQFVPMKLVDEIIDNIHLIETRKISELQGKELENHYSQALRSLGNLSGMVG